MTLIHRLTLLLSLLYLISAPLQAAPPTLNDCLALLQATTAAYPLRDPSRNHEVTQAFIRALRPQRRLQKANPFFDPLPARQAALAAAQYFLRPSPLGRNVYLAELFFTYAERFGWDPLDFD